MSVFHPPEAAAADHIEFGYWSDPLCIWALVAQPKLDHILELFGTCLQVHYHVVPVFGSVPWRLSRGPWADEGLAGRVESTRRIACEHGREDISGECWRRQTPASSWSPAVALEAVWCMERAGLVAPDTGAHYQRRIREAFFVDEQNVAHRTIQLALAEKLDIPRAPLEERLDDGSALALLWEDHRLKEELSIQGSPTYVFDDGRARLYGNFPAGVLEATVRELIRGRAPGCSDC
jgi:predicted DsbA family dithiol-disulfide isomerase